MRLISVVLGAQTDAIRFREREAADVGLPFL